jgi:hypothetical protein
MWCIPHRNEPSLVHLKFVIIIITLESTNNNYYFSCDFTGMSKSKASIWRRQLIKIGKRVKRADHPLTVREVLEMSHETKESTLCTCLFLTHCCVYAYFDVFCLVDSVPRCGWMFEWFIETAGSEKSLRLLKESKRALEIPDTSLSDETIELLIENDGPQFFLHILQSLRNIGLTAQRQMFYIGLVANFHGLSRRGLDLISSYSLMLPVRTHDCWRARELEAIRRRSLYALPSVSLTLRLSAIPLLFWGLSAYLYVMSSCDLATYSSCISMPLRL